MDTYYQALTLVRYDNVMDAYSSQRQTMARGQRVIWCAFEEFHRKTRYIHFGQFEIFEI